MDVNWKAEIEKMATVSGFILKVAAFVKQDEINMIAEDLKQEPPATKRTKLSPDLSNHFFQVSRHIATSKSDTFDVYVAIVKIKNT